ncbi:hypothetical protein Tco_0599209 [Tanacetum coccineum]
MDDLKRLKNQEKEANEEAEVLRKKFETLVIKEGAAKTSSTNIFSTVSTPVPKAKHHILKKIDDSEIPLLEDIISNYMMDLTTYLLHDEDAVA